MPTNKFFDLYNNKQEQSLVNDLVVESIQIFGHDLFYLPRTTINKSQILNEYQTYSFNDALLIEMYIKNIDAFEGDGQFLSKFGVEVRDQMTFTVSISQFQKLVGDNIQRDRPYEGDIIYMPMNGSAYQIKFVEDASVFFQLGNLYVFDITCELFEYSNETFATGIPEIDNKYNEFSIDNFNNHLKDENDQPLQDEYGQQLIDDIYNLEPLDWNAQNNPIEEEADDIIDFDVNNPFGENKY